eukprot:scaffold41398_cov76-Phaeocystis_antarctica.AAC.5
MAGGYGVQCGGSKRLAHHTIERRLLGGEPDCKGAWVQDGHLEVGLVLQDRRVAENGPVARDLIPLHLHSSSFVLVAQPNHRIERGLWRIRHSPAAAHDLRG